VREWIRDNNAERGKSDIDFILFRVVGRGGRRGHAIDPGYRKDCQPSKNNDGKDGNMNSTTEIPETAQVFGGIQSWTNSQRNNLEDSI
jgi:hypothetical protein